MSRFNAYNPKSVHSLYIGRLHMTLKQQSNPSRTLRVAAYWHNRGWVCRIAAFNLPQLSWPDRWMLWQVWLLLATVFRRKKP